MKLKSGLKFKEIFFTILISLIIWQIIMNPSFSIESAKTGLDLWFNLLLPSLFPFIFLSDLLISLGVVNYIGKYLEVIMKPLFNVSGVGIFPFVMSILSGYPVGSKLTSRLRATSQISKEEADRLITFTSTSGPLFILGTVLIGMLKLENISGLLLLPHYLGAISVGIIFRNYNKNKSPSIKTRSINSSNSDKSIPEPIGLMISNSIKDSIESILTVGGFVIIYSVIINALLTSSIFMSFIGFLSNKTNINSEMLKGLIAGIIEMTNGCNIVSSLNVDPIYKIILINFLIGWGGLSIHSQALSFISKTDIDSKIYFLAKFIHGLLAASYTYILYILVYKNRFIPTFNFNFDFVYNNSFENWSSIIVNSTFLALLLIVSLIIMSTIVRLVRRRA